MSQWPAGAVNCAAGRVYAAGDSGYIGHGINIPPAKESIEPFYIFAPLPISAALDLCMAVPWRRLYAPLV